jgi:hypothetical protein
MIHNKVGRPRSSRGATALHNLVLPRSSRWASATNSTSTRAMHRFTGLVCGIALVLTLGAGVSASQLPTDSRETKAVVQRIDHHMLLMLKLRTNKGFEVLVHG